MASSHMSGMRDARYLVVCNDVGAATVIAAYLQKHAKRRVRIFTSGPATKVFSRYGLKSVRIRVNKTAAERIVQTAKNGDVLLTGVGWMTSLEKHAIAVARSRGVPSIVYLDSWYDYREFFGYPTLGWKKKLPDMFWVGDRYAQSAAKKYFAPVPVRYTPNEYFKTMVARVTAQRKKPARSILFMSAALPGLEKLLKAFVSHMAATHPREHIIVRLHPADSPSRYQSIVASSGADVEISQRADIAHDLGRARIVWGPETAALALSLMVGKKTICVSVLKKEKLFPHKKLLWVRSIDELVQLL